MVNEVLVTRGALRFKLVYHARTHKPVYNKIPLKRDASGPEGYSDTSELD